MKKENIDKLISQLEREIVATQKDEQQLQSLVRLKEIAKTYQGEDKVISSTDIAERLKQKKDELKIFSGWRELDEILKGFRLQQLVVVSALTKSGKTSFLMDLTNRIKIFSPVWFPFEESAEELIQKFLERGQDHPLFFTPAVMQGTTVDWIEGKIVEAIAKYDSKVMFIDQLDFIVPFGADNHALRVGQTMRDLKSLAKKWNVVIFIVCHLIKARMDTEPTLEDLKGSSSIGQEADTVIMLWREMHRERGHVVITDNVNVSVQANRRTGRTGNVKMVYEDGKFIEKSWTSDAEHSARVDDEYKKF